MEETGEIGRANNTIIFDHAAACGHCVICFRKIPLIEMFTAIVISTKKSMMR